MEEAQGLKIQSPWWERHGAGCEAAGHIPFCPGPQSVGWHLPQSGMVKPFWKQVTDATGARFPWRL